MCKGPVDSGSATAPGEGSSAAKGAQMEPEPAYAWRLEAVAEGGLWRLAVSTPSSSPAARARAPEVELSAEAIRLRPARAEAQEEEGGAEEAGEAGAWTNVALPGHVLPIDTAQARCAFSRRRSELVIEWPQAAASAAEEAAEAAAEAARAEAPGSARQEGRDTPEAAAEGAQQAGPAAKEPDVSAEEWRTRGNAAVKAGDFEEACRCYAAGLSVGGGDEAMLRSNRAHCLQKLGRYQEAADDATCCVQLRPDFFKGYLRGATALRSLGKPEEALAFLRRCPANDEAGALAVELKPEAEAAQLKRIGALTGAEKAKEEGNVLFKKGQFEAAVAKYSSALDLCDDQEGALALAVRNNRAACAHQISDYSAVVRDASFVLRREPNNFKALVRRMLALEPLERYEAALADAQAVLRQDPRHEVANKMQHRLGKLVRDLQRERAAAA